MTEHTGSDATFGPLSKVVVEDATDAGVAGDRPALLPALLTPSALGLLVIVTLAVFADFFAPYGMAEINPADSLAPPSRDHLMGTDLFGRDVFSRVIYGGRLSLIIGFTAASIAAVLGVLMGVSAGYFRGVTDGVTMRIMDILLAFPSTLMAIVIVAVLGPSTINMILAVGIASSPGYARLVRSLALSLRHQEYVVAAQLTGCRPWTIIFRHVLPNLRNSVIVYATLDIATVILIAAGLGFLGLGTRPPAAEWGLMVADGRETLEIAWWVTFFPGLAILLTTFCIYSFGEQLATVLDPK